MLDEETRAAILKLHEKGRGSRRIAQALGISRGAVRGVLKTKSRQVPKLERAEKAEPHADAIRELYARCRGNLVRVHEELLAGGAELSYAALTAFCRRHHLVKPAPPPAGRYDFPPGEEMQHDTSPHLAHIGGAMRRVQTASLALCYSRMLFFQLYPAFNRFTCKVFLTDAARYFDGVCARCMVDNTHVVVLRGTGKEMVPVPEMEAFAERLGFTFVAHEKGDANRSGKVERPFHFIENNFLAGREFTDFAHANREAQAWCDKVNASFKRTLHARPTELFAAERPAMKRLPEWVPEVYALHQRIVDLEGYVHLGGHHYSVPYQLIGRAVEVRETKDRVRVFVGPRQVAEHERVLSGDGRRVTLPEHRPPRGTVRKVEKQPLPEERELSLAESPLPEYAAALKQRSSLRWPVALRRLAQMRRDYPARAFMDAVRTAAHYGLYDVERLERMVLRNIAHDYFVVPVDGLDADTKGPADEG
jgi:transposase